MTDKKQKSPIKRNWSEQSEQLKTVHKEKDRENTDFSEEHDKLVSEAINNVKSTRKAPAKPIIKKTGIDDELEEEIIGEEVDQYGHPELTIDNQHRPAFNFIVELIERRNYTTNDGREIQLTTKFCVSDRALGKTINTNIKLLYNASTDE